MGGEEAKLTPSRDARMRVKMTHPAAAAISSSTRASTTAPAVFMLVSGARARETNRSVGLWRGRARHEGDAQASCRHGARRGEVKTAWPVASVASVA